MQLLVGRDAEWQAVGEAMAGAGPWTVVIEGEAGIGKTALFRDCVASLDPATLVLTTRATAAETALGFTALTDLLAGVDLDAVDVLPEPQRHALGAATLRVPAGAEPIEPRAISTGLANLLTDVAATRPVVLAIDDAQWLDAASVGPLQFALRRAPVGLLVTVRGQGANLPLVADRGVEPLVLALGPLSAGALHQVLRQELGHALLRPALVRIAEAAGGNPLYAIELARTLERRGELVGAGDVLPVPESLAALTVGRLAALGDAARHTLLHAALASRPTVELLAAVDAAEGLDAAERAGVALVDRGQVELAHPLLAVAAVDLASPPERRAAHAALAGAVDDDELRARHLALASTAPSEAVAEALDRAVERTRARGATAAADELARLALEHSTEPEGPAAVARAATLAALSFEVGDAAESERLHRFVVAHGDARQRTTSHLALVETMWERGSADDCLAIARAAAEDAVGHPDLAARAHLMLAFLGDEREANTAAALAIVADEGIDNEVRAWAHLQAAMNGYEDGHGVDPAALDAALAMERTGRRWRSNDQVAVSRAAVLKHIDELDAGLAALQELRERATEEGNDGQLPYIVGHLVGALVLLGDLPRASAAAHEHLALAEATGQPSQRWQALVNLATVALTAGRFEEAEHVIAEVAEVDDPWAARTTAGVLGSVRLRRGDPVAAVRSFDDWWRLSSAIGGDVGTSRFHADRAEAMLVAGDVEGAAAFTAEIEAVALAVGRRSVAASMARVRALVLAAGGHLDAALAAADEALGRLDGLPMPIDRGRALLVKGQLHRRAREKSKARAALEAAVDTLAACGADGWAAVAAAELGRVNVRAAAPMELTTTERRIATLAAEGLTNREIAAAAFVSAKTVEANLARAYRKLGIRSRAQLGRVLAGEGAAET